MEESYRGNLVRSLKKTLEDGYFTFVIMDAVNNKVEYFEDCYNTSKALGFEVRLLLPLLVGLVMTHYAFRRFTSPKYQPTFTSAHDVINTVVSWRKSRRYRRAGRKHRS